MPAYAWLVHFPDDHVTDFGAHRELPKTGDEIITGWTVADYEVSKRRSRRDQVDVWVTAKHGEGRSGNPRTVPEPPGAAAKRSSVKAVDGKRESPHNLIGGGPIIARRLGFPATESEFDGNRGLGDPPGRAPDVLPPRLEDSASNRRAYDPGVRRAVSRTWSRMYFDAVASLGRAAARGTITKAECRQRVAAIDEWLSDRNLAIVADTDAITKHQLRLVRNPRAQ